MEKTILSVNGMACEHCVKAVTMAVIALSGVESVEVDLTAKTVAVEYDSAKISLDKIKAEIDDQGYEVVS